MWSRDGLRCRTPRYPPSLLNESTTPPYLPTWSTRPRQHVDRPPHRCAPHHCLIFCRSPPWVVLVGKVSGPGTYCAATKTNGENAASSARARWSRLKAATDVVGVIESSRVGHRSLGSKSKQRPLVLVGRSGYQQRSAWDLVQLRMRLGQWRKCLTAVTVRFGVVPRSARLDSAACCVRHAPS
jgi:hypothetical protein